MITPSTRLGLYEIISTLGSGRMGEVYGARDAKLHRKVTINVMPDAFARYPEPLARFAREDQFLAELSDSNMAHVEMSSNRPHGGPPCDPITMRPRRRHVIGSCEEPCHSTGADNQEAAEPFARLGHARHPVELSACYGSRFTRYACWSF